MYCKNCGAVLDDDAVFCEKCGKMIARKAVSEAEPDQGTVSAEPVQPSVSEEPDSAEKKKKSSMSLIAGICIAAVAAAAVLFVRGMSGPQEQLPSVLSQNNFHNGAIFAFDDNRIYFYASNEGQDHKQEKRWNNLQRITNGNVNNSTVSTRS